jgi:hypothetical protein
VKSLGHEIVHHRADLILPDFKLRKCTAMEGGGVNDYTYYLLQRYNFTLWTLQRDGYQDCYSLQTEQEQPDEVLASYPFQLIQDHIPGRMTVATQLAVGKHPQGKVVAYLPGLDSPSQPDKY